jgi:hypothetical protein
MGRNKNWGEKEKVRNAASQAKVKKSKSKEKDEEPASKESSECNRIKAVPDAGTGGSGVKTGKARKAQGTPSNFRINFLFQTLLNCH